MSTVSQDLAKIIRPLDVPGPRLIYMSGPRIYNESDYNTRWSPILSPWRLSCPPRWIGSFLRRRSSSCNTTRFIGRVSFGPSLQRANLLVDSLHLVSGGLLVNPVGSLNNTPDSIAVKSHHLGNWKVQ